MQAVAKHGGAPEREALVQEVLPRFLELAKNPYGHFLVSKLLALAPKPQLPGTPALCAAGPSHVVFTSLYVVTLASPEHISGAL